MNKDCYKADKFDFSVAGKFNQKNRRLKSKARRKENKEYIVDESLKVQCNKCGRYIDADWNIEIVDSTIWLYCPFCENDQVEIKNGENKN